MGKAYKNFWSLNVDEAIVSGILRDATPKNIEVFMPLNAQMKDIDLIIMNTKNKRTLTIQVKGSRAYEPKRNEIKKFRDGSSGWFFFPKKSIEKSTADYFIFLIYVLEDFLKTGRRRIMPHTIIIPTKEIKRLCKKYKIAHGNKRYSFDFWINPLKKQAFDTRDKKYYVNKYLDKEGINKLIHSLK